LGTRGSHFFSARLFSFCVHSRGPVLARSASSPSATGMSIHFLDRFRSSKNQPITSVRASRQYQPGVEKASFPLFFFFFFSFRSKWWTGRLSLCTACLGEFSDGQVLLLLTFGFRAAGSAAILFFFEGSTLLQDFFPFYRALSRCYAVESSATVLPDIVPERVFVVFYFSRCRNVDVPFFLPLFWAPPNRGKCLKALTLNRSVAGAV